MPASRPVSVSVRMGTASCSAWASLVVRKAVVAVAVLAAVLPNRRAAAQKSNVHAGRLQIKAAAAARANHRETLLRLLNATMCRASGADSLYLSQKSSLNLREV